MLGRLGKKFGREFALAVNSPSEAIRALLVIRPGLRKYLADSGNDGYGYQILVDDEPITDPDNELLFHHDQRRVYTLVPVVSGSKGGLGQIFAGIAIIAAAYFTAGAALAAFGSTMATTIGYSLGASLILGGITQLLTKTSVSPKPSEDTKDPSYHFNGAVNAREQGQPVAKGYGRMKVGGSLISLGISQTDTAV